MSRPRSRPSVRREGGGALLSLLGLAFAGAASFAPLELEADVEITARELAEHVGFLASDELQGRDTGTPELVEAAHYLADALREAGLEPAGDEGSFLQSVPLVQRVAEGDPALTLVDAQGAETRAEHGPDFLVTGGDRSTGRLRVHTVTSAETVPEPDETLALYLAGSTLDARAWLEDAGHADGAGFGAIVRRGSSREGRARMRPSRGGIEIGAPPEGATVELRVNGALRERFEAGEVAALELDQTVRWEELPAFNVVGRIQGVGTPERPELADEVVVFTAHYDHIGTREAPDDAPDEERAELDLVYNGADDDASGTACVLELAQRFAADPAPARTLLFLLVTAEEKGLLGTFYYLDHPVEPLERTVCNLNFEMIGRPDALAGGPGRLWLTGHERSNLFEAIREHEIPIAPDQRPDQNFFARSDNYAFALRGIVAQTLSSYDMHGDYHGVDDEADRLDYEHMEAGVRAAYTISRLVADGAIDPEWLPGGSPQRR